MAQANSNTLSMQSPERVAETYGGNKQKIARAIQMGVIDPTTGLMAGMFIDRMRSAQAQEQAPNQTVAQRVLGPQAPPAPPGGPQGGPQGGPPPGAPPMQMASAPPPPQMVPPAPQGPVRMAGGGLTTLPIPDDMYDEQSFAGGGIVAFADAGDVRTKRRKALMNIIRTAETSDQRMAARMELNAMDGMGPGRTPGPGLADALADLDAATGAPVGGTRLDPAEFNRNPSPSNLFRNAEAAQRGPQMPNFSGFGDAIMAANLRETDAARGTDASGGMSLRSPELAAIDARSRARNEAAGQVPFRGPGIMDLLNQLDEATGAPVGGTRMDPSGYKEPPANLFRNAEAAQRGPFRGFGDTADRMAAILGDAEINTYGNREAAQRGPRAMGSIDNLGELTRTIASQFSPPPSDPTGLNALIASNNPNVRPASSAVPTSKKVPSAPVRTPAPRGERGVVGAPRATRAPATTEKETTPAAGTDTPNAMTLREIQARIDEAGKLPEFQRTSAEELAARKNEDLYSILAQIGFGMAAGESPNALTNIGKAAAAAMPAMQAAAKERRADTKEERNREFDYLAKAAGIRGDNFKSAYTIFSSMEDREQRAYLEKLRIKAQEKENRLNREVQREGQAITAAGQRITADHYNNMSNKERQIFDFKAKVIADAEGISMVKARNKLLQMELARRTGSTNNAEDTAERVKKLGGNGDSFPGFKHLGTEPEGD